MLLIINIKINATGVSKGHRTLYCNYSCICWCVDGGTNEKLLKTEYRYLSSPIDRLEKQIHLQY